MAICELKRNVSGLKIQRSYTKKLAVMKATIKNLYTKLVIKIAFLNKKTLLSKVLYNFVLQTPTTENGTFSENYPAPIRTFGERCRDKNGF
jgi:hypothetical protein